MFKKKILAIAVAAVALFASVQVMAANFADINDVPWEGAKTYINSVADNGIMVGDYNDYDELVFRPKDSVSYNEVVQLSYSLLQKTQGVSVTTDVQTKWTTVMNGYKIPTWAYPAVSYALENSIITISDLPIFMASDGSSAYATRQDVAVIFGRLLEDYGTLQTNPTLSYGDAASINSVAVPYVDLLTTLGIVSGDTDGNFTPKANINRAEMSVLVSKTFDVMGGANATTGSISGTVQSVQSVGSNTILTVYGNSQTLSFMGDFSTQVVYGSSTMDIEDIAVGYEVLVSYTGQNIISILVTDTGTSTETSTEYTVSSTEEGYYVSVYDEYIRIKQDGVTYKYYFIFDECDSAFYYEDDEKISYDDFEDIVEEWGNNKIELSLNSNDEVVKVTIYRNIRCELVGVYSTYVEVKINGSTETFYYDGSDSDDVDFMIDGEDKTYSKFKSTYESGDIVEILIDEDDDDEITEINLLLTESAREGTLSYITSSYIVLEVDGDEDTYYYTNDSCYDVTYIVNGSTKTYSTFKNYVEEGDSLLFILDSSGEIKSLEFGATSDEIEGYLVSISSTYIKIEEESSGDEVKYYYEDSDYENVQFYYEGDKETYSYVKSVYEDDDDVVLILNSDGEVTYVYIEGYSGSNSDNEVSGEILVFSSTYIKIEEDDTGDDVKYYYDDYDYENVSFYYDSTLKYYSYVKNKYDYGDDVTLILDDDGYVTKVYIGEYSGNDGQYEISGDLTYVTETRAKVDGSYYYFIDNDVDECDIEIVDGKDTITDYDTLEQALADDKEIYVEIVTDDDEIEEMVGYVSKFYGLLTKVSVSSEYIEVQGEDSGDEFRYYLDEDVDISVDSGYDNDLDGLYDAYKYDDVYVTIELNKDGEVTEIDADCD